MEKRDQRARSAISNGNRLLPDVPLRSSTARRWKDLHATFFGIVADHAGGPERVSEAQRLQVKYLAGLCLWAEQQTAHIADGDQPFDALTFNRAMGTIQRLMDRLGIGNEALAVAESLDDDDGYDKRIVSNSIVHGLDGRGVRRQRLIDR